jgi:hypothetical protein
MPDGVRAAKTMRHHGAIYKIIGRFVTGKFVALISPY